MSEVLVQPRTRRSASGNPLAVVAFACAVVVLWLAVARVTALPAYVRRVTVTNPYGYDVKLDVARRGGDGWLGVGTVDRRSSRAYTDVVDQGPTWVLRFSHTGTVVGEVSVARAELRRGGWSITIPRLVADKLAAAGEPQAP